MKNYTVLAALTALSLTASASDLGSMQLGVKRNCMANSTIANPQARDAYCTCTTEVFTMQGGIVALIRADLARLGNKRVGTELENSRAVADAAFTAAQLCEVSK